MKKITITSIKKLNPCRSGFDNLIKHYPKFKGNELDFLKLEHIPYDDKIWLLTRINLEDKVWQYWSLACASSQLDNTDDVRVRQSLEIVESYLKGESTMEELSSARSAARLAQSSTRSAAESAAWSAWSAAQSSRSASWSARSAARLAARSAAQSAESAYSTQEEVNILLLIDVIEGLHE